jgi:hypothetical protein
MSRQLRKRRQKRIILPDVKVIENAFKGQLCTFKEKETKINLIGRCTSVSRQGRTIICTISSVAGRGTNTYFIAYNKVHLSMSGGNHAEASIE